MKKLIVAVAALALMATSAYAAEWDFYGNARIYTGWAQDDNKATAALNNDDDWHYGEFLAGTSRVGAKIKVSDELTANFEYGTGVNVRHLYGKWDFGGGYLLVGHTTTPVAIGYSNQIVYNAALADNGLSGFGNADTGRSAQIQVGFGGFKIAIMNTDDGDIAATQKIIPQIAASYTMGFDMGEVVVGGIYNTYEAGNDDIDSYVISVGTSLTFGPAGVFATAVYGQNIGIVVDDYAQAGFAGGQPGYAAGEQYDTDSLGFTIGASFTVNEMFALEAGYGYIQDDPDFSGSDKNKGQSYYVQSTITLAPGVIVVPELGFIDLKEANEADITYFAAKWQINF